MHCLSLPSRDRSSTTPTPKKTKESIFSYSFSYSRKPPKKRGERRKNERHDGSVIDLTDIYRDMLCVYNRVRPAGAACFFFLFLFSSFGSCRRAQRKREHSGYVVSQLTHPATCLYCSRDISGTKLRSKDLLMCSTLHLFVYQQPVGRKKIRTG